MMKKKNSQIHLMIDTEFKEKLKNLANQENLHLSEYCRNKLSEDSKLIKLERMIEMLLVNSSKFDLNYLAFERLKECRCKNGIIYFKDIWIKLCTSFSIKKEDCWKLLRDFERDGKIKFVRCKGVRILTC